MAHIRADGRIHPSLKIAGTRTGRLSCANPNLQNITAPYTWYGKMARDIFSVPKGRVMVQLDFSQLELRVAAMLSGDQKMREIFMAGEDYHQKTAELIAPVAWGIRPDQVTKDHRKKAKIVNFGLLYGMGDAGLAVRIGSTKQEARKIRQGVLGSFNTYAQWSDDQVETAKGTGFTWTWWRGRLARRRSLWRILDPDGKAANTAKNGAANTPVQGTASDFCLASLVACVEWLRRTNFPAKLVLTVHDSLIFEVDIDYADELVTKVTEIMQGWPSDGVPILSDAEIGLSWGSLVGLENRNGEWLAVWEEKIDGEKVEKTAPWRDKIFS
jgi:DNA polymerase-1